MNVQCAIMEEFVFDLDKALDELEENEDKEQQCATLNVHGTGAAPQRPSAPSLACPNYPFVHNGALNGIGPSVHDGVLNNSQDYITNRDTHGAYEAPVKLDMSDADFAPSVTLTTKRSIGQCQQSSAIQNGIYSPSSSDNSVEALPFTFPSLTPVVDNIVTVDFSMSSETAQRDLASGMDSISEANNGHLETEEVCKNERDLTHDVQSSIADHLKVTDRNLSTAGVQDTFSSSGSSNVEADVSKDLTENTASESCDHASISEDVDMHTTQCEEKMTSETVQDTSLSQSQSISLTTSPTVMETKTEIPECSVAEADAVHTVSSNSISIEHEVSSNSVSNVEVDSETIEMDTASKEDNMDYDATPLDNVSNENAISSEIEMELKTCLATGSSEVPTVALSDVSSDVEEPKVTGFSNINDLDLSSDDLEQYLSTIGGPDNYSEFDSKPSFADEMKMVDSCNMQHDAGEPVHPIDELTVPGHLDERRDSGGSVEKFLVPMVMSPGITTPIDDPGYSKVPGYTAELSTTIEETEDTIKASINNYNSDNVQDPPNIADAQSATQHAILRTHSSDSAVGSSEMGVGARPKEPIGRISRPNSLLGLSTPDLPTLTSPPPTATTDLPVVAKAQPVLAVNQAPSLGLGPAAFLNVSARDSGIVADSSEFDSGTSSPNETANTRSINDLINTQLAAQKSLPLKKKHLNLEIKQNLDEGQQLDNRYSADITEHEAAAMETDLPQRPMFLGTEIPSPAQSANTVMDLSAQLTLPSGGVVANEAPEATDHVSLPAGPSRSVLGSSPQQKRPSSLSIIPHSEEQLNQDLMPTSDLALEASSPMGTPATGEVATAGAESPMDNMQGISLEPEIGAVGPLGSTDATSPTPPTSSNINLAITELGKVAPVWVPDAEAPVCMQCEARFTFTKRRHHCRACGKVFCNGCCNLRSRLIHMENKEARVCSKCYQDLIRAQSYERMHQPSVSPNPNNPSEYCSTVPPLQQAAGSLNAPPPTVMVPSGVLRKDGTYRRSVEGPKQVMFSDGIRPGGDLTELDGVPDNKIPPQRVGRKIRRLDKSDDKNTSPRSHAREHHKSVCLIPDQGLPPVLLSTGVKGDFSIEEKPVQEEILPKIRSTDDPEPVVFAINKNLFVLVKILTLDCCVNRVCWCFTTKGMCTVGQDEIIIVLECLPDEKTVPRDIFCHLHAVYEEASKGNTVSHLGHTIFAQGFLDCRDHSGFLYINASYQCLQKLILPSQPYIFGILLQRWETPWAKVFPIRLMLRMGAEYRYYPCPLISVRFRKPVFGEIGHTIMNLLADFRNYQYMLPQVPGVTIHMEDKQTCINFPRNRYSNIMKVLTSSNDHVMALASNFSLKADSHLVCIQNDDGSYQTQAINIQNKPRKVTGASFVVFNGAFKQTGGLRAKSSIVEDGLMVQITAEMMVELKESMRNMTDYCIGCGDLDIPAPEETVTVRWVEDDTNVNIGVKSPMDNMLMDGKESIRIHSSTDFIGEKHMIRWTECFFIQNQTDSNSRCEPVDLSRLAESLAQATCIALTPKLSELQEAHLTKIGLRATIDPEKTCYEVGANGTRLPPQYMDVLDNALISVIHNAASRNQEGPVILELIFHVIE